MRTPTSLFDLNNMIADLGLEATYYDGHKLTYQDIEIGLISVYDKWVFKNDSTSIDYTTDELKEHLIKIIENLRKNELFQL